MMPTSRPNGATLSSTRPPRGKSRGAAVAKSTHASPRRAAACQLRATLGTGHNPALLTNFQQDLAGHRAVVDLTERLVHGFEGPFGTDLQPHRAVGDGRERLRDAVATLVGGGDQPGVGQDPQLLAVQLLK